MSKKTSRRARIVQYFNEQSGLCAYCHDPMTLELNKPNTAEVEHIIPKGYRRIPGHFNEVAACTTCNRIKADRPLHECIGELITRKYN